jgi:uncharacterized membrane protein
MAESELKREHPDVDPDALPFVAPCKILSITAPLHWLKLGWQDFRRAPDVSLMYGGFLILISYALAYFTWQLGGYILFLSFISGFIFLAPMLAFGLYSISCQLEAGRKPQIGYCLREGKRHIGNEMVYSVILLIIFLIWARASSAIHIFFPMEANPDLSDLAVFLSVGTIVGSLFATLVFSASAFSLPMMLDKKVDTVTAVLTSVNAVLRNKGAMVVWALIIVSSLAISFATAFLGLAILMPVIGYAAWHGYQETILADDWPDHIKLSSENPKIRD